MKNTAIITDIQRYSVHDGPGIRTMVFFKGCPLRCRWCHNPETNLVKPQIMVNKELCIGCGVCLSACPNEAVSIKNGRPTTDYKRCTACGACAEVCYAGAREISGRSYGLDEVEEIVLKDEAFYRKTEGGVTLSGGEVLMQAEYASELLKRLKDKSIHTAIETCGFSDWKNFERLIPYLDLALFDVKHYDNEKHRKFTGRGNMLILENLRKLSKTNVQIVIRVPVVPGVNDDPETIIRIAKIAKEIRALKMDLLPFHQIGSSKWDAVGTEYTFSNVAEPDKEKISRLAKAVKQTGVKVCIGG